VGVIITDAGANSTVTLKVDDNKFAALTGSNFTGAVSFDSGGVSALTKGTDVFNWFSGSATKDGGPTVTTQNRKVAVFGGDIIASGTLIISGAVSFDSQLRSASFLGTDVYHFVSGTFGPTSGYQRRVALFGGDVISSGSFQANFFSGSIQKTFGGLSYLVASGSATVTSMSNGQILIFAPAAGGGASSGDPGEWLHPANNQMVSTGSISVDGGNVAANTKGTDIMSWFSGSCGLTGSGIGVNATRKATVFGGDLFYSGSIEEARPTLFTGSYEFHIRSGSQTANATPFVAYTFAVPTGSMRVEARAVANNTATTFFGDFVQITHIKNVAGTLTQLGTVPGVGGGSVVTGSAWGIGIDTANNLGRLVLTGSATNVSWAWWIDAFAVKA
jgi:hypothetical protein